MFKVTNPGGVGILVCIFPLPFLSFLCLLSELHSFKKIEAQISTAKIGPKVWGHQLFTLLVVYIY